ncbi:MAG: TonB-dependent receptor domain-containing protein [Sediminibacterium sp.]
MKYNILFIFLLFITFSSKGQYIFSGKLTSGKPIMGALVQVKSNNANTLTDSTGYFRLSLLKPAKVIVHITAAGFEPIDTTIEITKDTYLAFYMQEKFEALEEVVIVSSSRNNSRIEDLPTKIEVLGAEEMQEENQIKPGNIASILGDIAGIQIQQTNAATGNADMRIQGLQGKYTQILRDGMTLFGGFSGSFGILQIPPLDVQQVELIKGASSTLYGGGAIAGMLNIVSKRPKNGAPEKNITLNYSSLQEKNINLFFSGRNKKNGYTLFAGGNVQPAIDVNKDGFSDVPKTNSIFIHPRYFRYINEKETLILGYTFTKENRKGGDMFVLDNKPNILHQFYNGSDSYRNGLDLNYENKLSDNEKIEIKANLNAFNRKIETNTFGLNAIQSMWYSEFAYSKNTGKQKIIVGANFNGDNFSKSLPDSSLLPSEKNATTGIFGQLDIQPNSKTTIQTGLRIDATNHYGIFVLPRISIMYKPNHEWTLRASSGLGYKPPTLFNNEIDERDYRYIKGYASNITSEKSIGYNADVNYKTHINDWSITLNQTFFYTQINKPTNLYYQYGFIGTRPLFAYYINEDKPLITKGYETYIAAKKDELELYLGYVFTDAKRTYNNYFPTLPLIAKHKIATVVAYEFSEKLRAGIEAAYTGKQTLDNGTQTNDYVFAAAMIRYGVGKVSFVFNIENIFDYRQNKNNQVVFPPYTNPSFPEIWAPLDGRVANLSMLIKL